MKVEGYWSLKNREASIQNKNIPFIAHLEKILKNYGLTFRKRLLIKVKVPNGLAKEDIKVVNSQNRPIKFHIEISPFDRQTRKIVFNLPFKKQKVIISLKGILFPLTVLLKKEEILTKCILSSFAYVDLRFWNIRFLRFLDKIAGKSNGKLQPTSSIDKSNLHVISAFSALVDAEGTIDFDGVKRGIRVRLKDKNYLEAWKSLLSKCDISSCVTEDGKLHALTIYGIEDFKRLLKLGFRLFHSEKENKFNLAIKSFLRYQLSREKAKTFYFEKLKEIGKPISAPKLAKILKKNRRTIYHYLGLLVKEDKVRVIKTKPHQLYSIF